jgi:hypothetical protein
MKTMRTFWSGIAAAALLTVGAAQAQYRDRYGNQNPYGNRGDNRYGNGGYGYNYGGNLVPRVLSDLDRAASARYADKHERKHFDQARKDLLRFQENGARGKFDRDRLDGAIDHLSHLANSDRLHPRDRQMLARDMQDLREFRSRGRW